MRSWWALTGTTLVFVAGACGRTAERAPDPGPGDAELVARTGVPESVLVALRRHGSDLRQLEGTDSGGNVVGRPGVSAAIASEARARAAVAALRRKLGGGYVVLRTEQGFGRAPDRVSVVRAGNAYEVLHLIGTNGWNYDIGPDSVVAWLRGWDQAVGLTIVGAGNDWLEARIERPPADMLPFARAVYRFCPDVVEQGTETVEALADEMARTRTLYLWGD